jgi:hypothetical protein
MKKLLLSGLITCIFELVICNQIICQTSITDSQSEWKTFQGIGYLIQYPGSWDLDKSGKGGTSFIILSKLSSQQDKFRENVNLIIQDLSGQNINLDKYVEISEGQVKTMINKGKILESKRLNANKLEFHKIIYTGEQGIYLLKYEQYYWIKNNKAYVLTLTCEINQFDKFKIIGEKILNSFVLK